MENEVSRHLVEKYGVDLLTATILYRRGAKTADDIKYFLESDVTYLHSPFLFEDMEMVVERIGAAVEEGEKVCIFGDRDADGITSTALLTLELRSMGLEVESMLPEGDSPYGLTMDAVQKLKEQGVTLVITVDCGISNVQEIAALSDAGIDTLVFDHHLAGDVFPSAVAIIDPKIAGSGYPFMDLSGCGVVAKVIWALRFARTDLYGMECILLHAEPGPGDNTSTIIQAIRLENLMETDSLVEEVPNGALSLEQSRIIKFLNCNLPIFVLDEEIERRQLSNAFGNKVDIHLVDIRQMVESVIPQVKGQSLLTLSVQSRQARYAEQNRELETLVSLFRSYCLFKNPSLTREYEKILDLVAIATVADLMPIKDENRILVKRGLKVLSEHPREQLVPLLAEQSLLSRPISATDIGWHISPVINASGRLGCPEVALNMLLSDNRQEIEELTKKLLALNKERQKMGERAWEKVQPLAKQSLEAFGSKFVMVEDDTLSRGLTGSLASRLLKESGAPAALVMTEAEEGRISGSVRSKDCVHARNFLSLFSDLFIDYGGHKCAGGFSMKAEMREEFKKALEDAVYALDESEDTEELAIDACIPSRFMTPALIRTVEVFEPFGEQNPPLQFYIENASLEDIVHIGSDKEKGHIRLSVKFGDTLWNAMFWGGAKRIDEGFAIGDSINLAFKMARNYWKGASTLQLTVLDIEKRNT